MITTLSLFILFAWGLAVAVAWASLRILPRVKPEPPDPALPLPRLTVIVPARDEAESIGRCLESLLAQEHPDLEIIAVNDRSTDGTGALMDEIAARSEGRLSVIHVEELPEGWIGKCHAIHCGVQRATGEHLLFTDGDVIFEPGALLTAAQRMERQEIDHLLFIPGMELHTTLERVAVMNHTFSFLALCPPAMVHNPQTPTYMGVGAFNYVRRSVYERAGGHERLRLHVIDDLGLGQMMKAEGGRVRMVRGESLIHLRWQRSALGLITGLEKNAFAAMGYRLSATLLMVAFHTLCVWGPWVGLFVGSNLARSACVVTVLGLQPLAGLIAAKTVRVSGFHALLFTPGTLFTPLTLLNSAVRTLMRGGVRWRDTVYSLAVLRAFRRDFNRAMRAKWKLR